MKNLILLVSIIQVVVSEVTMLLEYLIAFVNCMYLMHIYIWPQNKNSSLVAVFVSWQGFN